MVMNNKSDTHVRLEAERLYEYLKAVRDWGAPITSEYVKRFGMWSVNDQIAHCTEELGEIRKAYRREGFMPTLEEAIDHWLTSTTLFTILHAHSQREKDEFDAALKMACYTVVKKLYRRIGWYSK